MRENFSVGSYKEFNTEHECTVQNARGSIGAHYLLKLFFWIGFWAILIIGFIWFIDPYGVSPIKLNFTEVNAFKPKRLDIDRFIKPYEVWRFKPKTLFIGTSHIHESIDPSVFDATEFAPAYNAAIPASTLAQNLDNIELFLKLDHNIKHIFMELFFFNFTGQTQEFSPKSIGQFVKDIVPLQISGDAFFDSVKTLQINRQGGARTPYIAKKGFWVPSSDFNPNDTFNESLFIHSVISLRPQEIKLHQDALVSLTRIINLVQKHGVKLHLIITPTHPWDDYRLMSLGYWPTLEQWLHKMASYPNVVSFSQYNEMLEEIPSPNSRMKWWNDPTHFSLNMGHEMMLAFLGRTSEGTPSNIIRQISQRNIDSVLEERRAGVMRWALEHKGFVDDFEEAKLIPKTVEGFLDEPKRVLVINGYRHPLVLGVGKVEFVIMQPQSALLNGWAADEVEKRHASYLVAVIGSKVVAQGFTTAARDDVALALGERARLSGFVFPLSLQTWNGKDHIRVFAIMKNGRAVQLSSNSSFITSDSITSSKEKIEKNKLIIGNKVYPIVSDRIGGSIESVAPAVNGYNAQGWAADVKAKAPVVAIIATLGPKVIAKDTPFIYRDDIAQGIAAGAHRSGFNINIPLRKDQMKDHSVVQLFAIMADDVAVSLASNQSEATKGLFKNVAWNSNK